MIAYRNAGPGAYHVAGDDWLRTGIAVCGQSIATPGFTASTRGSVADLRAAVELTGRRLCGHCYAITYSETGVRT